MAKLLYLECAAGISGDMAVAALLDLGASEERLRQALASLPVDGFEVQVSRVKKSGLDACDFNVVLDQEHENHDHDMAYLHGGEGQAAPARSQGHGEAHDHGHGHARSHEHGHGRGTECGHDHAHDHDHGCAHDHDHDHGHVHDHGHAHPHAHGHRGPKEIAAIIDGSAMTDGAKQIAHRIFDILTQAEAKAHGVPADEVHFHEVGAVDSIVDVLSAAVCLDDLGVKEAVVTELCEGRGTVRCQHGIMPVPVPAVANIVQAHSLPLRVLDVQGELVTPTGAAIAAAVRTRGELPGRFSIERVGLGAGKREYATSGILRAMLIQEQ